MSEKLTIKDLLKKMRVRIGIISLDENLTPRNGLCHSEKWSLAEVLSYMRHQNRVNFGVAD